MREDLEQEEISFYESQKLRLRAFFECQRVYLKARIKYENNKEKFLDKDESEQGIKNLISVILNLSQIFTSKYDKELRKLIKLFEKTVETFSTHMMSTNKESTTRRPRKDCKEDDISNSTLSKLKTIAQHAGKKFSEIFVEYPRQQLSKVNSIKQKYSK